MMSCKIQRTRFMQGYTVHAYIQKATGPGDWKLQIVLDCLQKVREILKKKNNLGFLWHLTRRQFFFAQLNLRFPKQILHLVLLKNVIVLFCYHGLLFQ